MRSLLLLLLRVQLLIGLSLPAVSWAASYEQNDGTIVDPILYTVAYGVGVHPYAGPNLTAGAELTSADLTGADLYDALLSGANLELASLRDANLFFSGLNNANLDSADLIGANLSFAFLLNASLVDADLAGANLRDAYLLGADLTGAYLDAAIYDEFTVFPSGNDLYAGGWGLPGGAAPWELGMVPAPEPTAGLMLAVGGLALAGMGRRS